MAEDNSGFSNSMRDMMSEEDRRKLMEARSRLQPLESAMQEGLLQDQTDAASTPLGQLLGMSSREDDISALKASRTPEQQARASKFKEAMDMGMAMGQGIGSTGLNKMTPQMLAKLKGGTAKGAARGLVQEAPEQAAAKITTAADDIADPALKKMLREKELERLENIVSRTEQLIDNPAMRDQSYEFLMKKANEAQARRNAFRDFMKRTYPDKK